MTVQEAQKIFPAEFIQQLTHILINGNFGDAVMNLVFTDESFTRARFRTYKNIVSLMNGRDSVLLERIQRERIGNGFGDWIQNSVGRIYLFG